MPLDLPLRCQCGRMRGVASHVSPSSGFRFVCYCGDCQAFARFLDRADVLDHAGGTDIFHMPPGARENSPRARTAFDACASPARSCAGTANVAGRRLPTRPRGRASRSSAWCIPSWTTRPTVDPGTRCSVRRSAGSSNAPPSGRCRRTRRLRRSVGLFARRASTLLGWWVRGLGSAHAVLRRSDQGSARRAARAQGERARGPLTARLVRPPQTTPRSWPSRLRKAASPASDTLTHFGSGAASGT